MNWTHSKIETCIWKILHEMYGQNLENELPEFRTCIRCSGFEKDKDCYMSLKYHLDTYLQKYQMIRHYKED